MPFPIVTMDQITRPFDFMIHKNILYIVIDLKYNTFLQIAYKSAFFLSDM
jgi:hypothetical protein